MAWSDAARAAALEARRAHSTTTRSKGKLTLPKGATIIMAPSLVKVGGKTVRVAGLMQRPSTYFPPSTLKVGGKVHQIPGYSIRGPIRKWG